MTDEENTHRAPAQSGLTVDDVRKTVADEWGSHVCYHDSFGRRSCKKDNQSGVDDDALSCRCDDIARAIVSQHGAQSPAANVKEPEVILDTINDGTPRARQIVAAILSKFEVRRK